jgi:hypothetical protein
MHQRDFLALLVTLTFLPSFALAGAWTLPKKTQQHIITYRTYETTSYFSGDGKRRDKRGNYTKQEVNYYNEVGVTNFWTLGSSLTGSRTTDVERFDSFTPFGETTEATRTLELAGLTRSAFFARYQLHRDEDYALSVQPLVALPALYTTTVPEGVTKDPFEMEISATVGKNFALMGQNHYAEIQAGYRYRSGILGNQTLLRTTLGISLNENWTLMPELNYTGLVGGVNYAATTITGQNDYSLTTPQFSALYRVTDSVRVQAGVFSHAAGRNTGAGGGTLLSLWIQL